jgi:molybdenum cofactor cytidylyltransferase
MARTALTSANSVGAIVLDAGRSTRMGHSNKLLADLGGAPVIARAVDALIAAGLPPPLVVVGHMASSVRAALAGRIIQFTDATDYADGLSRTLAAGLAAAPNHWQAALIVLGDMPMVTVATLTAIARAADAEDGVVVPIHDGRRGNPVAWGRAHWCRLAALTGDRGSRALLDDIDVIEVATNDGGIHVDVDTPGALATLRRAYSSS